MVTLILYSAKERVFFKYGICSVNYYILLAFSRDGNIAEYRGYVENESGYLKIRVCFKEENLTRAVHIKI